VTMRAIAFPLPQGRAIALASATEPPSSFDRLRMRRIFRCGRKKEPHAEPVEARTALARVSCGASHDLKGDDPSRKERGFVAEILS